MRGFKLFCSIPENLTETSSPAGTIQADGNNQCLYLHWNGISSGVTRHLVPNRSSLADKCVFEPQKVEAWGGGGHKGWFSTRGFLGGLDLTNLQGKKVKVLVPQSCPTHCDSTDYSPPGSSVHGFSTREHWSVLPFPPPEDLPEPGIEPRSPISQADSLPSEPPPGSGGKRDLAVVGGGDGDTAVPLQAWGQDLQKGPLQVWEQRASYLVREQSRSVCWTGH